LLPALEDANVGQSTHVVDPGAALYFFTPHAAGWQVNPTPFALFCFAYPVVQMHCPMLVLPATDAEFDGHV